MPPCALTTPPAASSAAQRLDRRGRRALGAEPGGADDTVAAGGLREPRREAPGRGLQVARLDHGAHGDVPPLGRGAGRGGDGGRELVARGGEVAVGEQGQRDHDVEDVGAVGDRLPRSSRPSPRRPRRRTAARRPPPRAPARGPPPRAPSRRAAAAPRRRRRRARARARQAASRPRPSRSAARAWPRASGRAPPRARLTGRTARAGSRRASSPGEPSPSGRGRYFRRATPRFPGRAAVPIARTVAPSLPTRMPCWLVSSTISVAVTRPLCLPRGALTSSTITAIACGTSSRVRASACSRTSSPMRRSSGWSESTPSSK